MIHVGNDLARSALAACFRDDLMMRAGMVVQNPHELSGKHRHSTLVDMARDCLSHQGVDVVGLSRPEIARLAFNRQAIVERTGNVQLYASTVDFPNILADTINKSLGIGFQLAPDTTQWCRTRPLPDFKQASTVKLSAAPPLMNVTAGAKYDFYSFSDQGERYTLAKYGYIIGINWETILNDDLGALTTAPQSAGMACRALKLDLVYSVLTNNPTMGDGNALFDDATHHNLITGAWIRFVAYKLGKRRIKDGSANLKRPAPQQRTQIPSHPLRTPWRRRQHPLPQRSPGE